jgi:Xaa-Pro dipeptidase
MTMQASADGRQRVQLGAAHYQRRLAQIAAALAKHDIEGVLLLDAANVMWATGFFHIPNERPLGVFIPADGAEPLFLVPFLEQENAAEQWAGAIRCYLEFPGEVPAPVWMMEQIDAAQITVDTVDHTRGGRTALPQG